MSQIAFETEFSPTKPFTNFLEELWDFFSECLLLSENDLSGKSKLSAIQEAKGMKDYFRRFSQKTSELVGSPGAFMLAILLLVLWAVSGSIFHYSDTWQLVINTATTIVTFLMVFLIQNTQNRDARALHLKLDELIRSIQGARNTMVDLEEMSDEELEKFQQQFRRMSKHYTKMSSYVAEIANVNDDKEPEEKKK